MLGISLLACVVLVLVASVINKGNKEKSSPYHKRQRTSLKKGIENWLSPVLLKSYAICMKVPPLRYYVYRCRKRLGAVHVRDEFELRRITMKLVYSMLLIMTTGMLFLLLLNPTISFLIVLIITGVVIQGLILDSYVHRLEVRLLEQMLRFFTAVRHAYHRHGMVADSIEEAGESVGEEMSYHANMLYEALTSAKPEEELDKYNQVAPSRFLKAFGGISRLIMEFGDRKRTQGSIYLNGISNLTEEIQLDLIRRSKLDYLLKGLHVIALVPLFFTKPVEVWARSNFPLMDYFYLSKFGIIIKILLFVIILISYVLLQKLQNEDETTYRAGEDRKPWEAKAYQWTWVRIAVSWFMPSEGSNQAYKTKQLLKETNHSLQYSWFQLRRLTLFVVSALLSLAVVIGIHEVTKSRIMEEAPSGYVMFGKMNGKDEAAAIAMTKLEAAIIEEAKASGDSSNEAITTLVSNQISNQISNQMKDEHHKQDNNEIMAVTDRVLDKLNRLNNEYLKWWEIVISLGIGAIAYYTPYLLLLFRRKMLLMQMRQEVYQFGTMIMMLKELERISVEEILEWMHTYAVIFKMPIQRCLLHYDHDAELALKQLKEEIILDEFQHLVDKLLLSVEKIPIQKAFDDLQSDMTYHFERRRLAYEKSIDVKAGIGRMIGFTPMYALIFGYLVIPLIWMSFKQMDIYFTQIQKLS